MPDDSQNQNALGTEEYSVEELEELENLINSQVISFQASERVASAPDDSKFVVYGRAEKGSVIVYDDGSVQDVVDRVPLGIFGSKAEAESFAVLSTDIVSSGGNAALDWWEGLTSIEMDTYSASSVEEATADLQNSALLQNLLTSNSPTINIPMLMDELCKVIVPMAESLIDGGKTEIKLMSVQEALAKAKRILIRRIVSLIYSTLQNASQKLRRMAASKVKQLLAEYVADTCYLELANAIDDFQNPENLLSLEELGATFEDIISGTLNPVGQIVNELSSTAVTGWKNVITAFDAMMGDTEAKKIMNQSMVVMVACATEFACARSKTFADSKLQALSQTVSDSIKKTMQGCLFQQALKTTKQFAPDSLPADVLNRVSNLARNGEMMDAYNVALAAGVDLQGAPFRVKLPSASKWVSEIYGDPYLFSPEKPSNAQQVADYIMGSLPTSEQLMTGTVTKEQMLDSAIAENWTEKDQRYAASQSTIDDQIEYKKQVIDGTQMTGKTVSFPNGISYDSSGQPVINFNPETGSLITDSSPRSMVKPK